MASLQSWQYAIGNVEQTETLSSPTSEQCLTLLIDIQQCRRLTSLQLPALFSQNFLLAGVEVSLLCQSQRSLLLYEIYVFLSIYNVSTMRQICVFLSIYNVSTMQCRIFMIFAIWAPFMLGRTTRPCLYDFLAYLAKADTAAEGGQDSKSNRHFQSLAWGREALTVFLGKAVWLLGKSSTIDGQKQNNTGSTDARLSSLSPLNRLAARLEASLTGLELGDWFCLGLGYGKYILHFSQMAAK